MPMIKRQEFVPLKPPPDLKPDEDIFFFKLTNEIFRNYEEYFERVILCNSLVWSCSITGKINLTFQEALDSERNAKKVLDGFPKELKIPLLLLTNMTYRGKVLDVYEDIFSYSREHYFKGEIVLAVIGNLWCHSRIVRVILPTPAEIEAYKKDQIEKGEYEKNDYLKDMSWGPPPDLFRYEVQEIDSESGSQEMHVLEAIDVKREKTCLTRDKCRSLIKLHTYYNEVDRAWRVQEDIAEAFGLKKMTFQSIFDGDPPVFEETLGPIKTKKTAENKLRDSHAHKAASSNKKKPAEVKKSPKQQNGKVVSTKASSKAPAPSDPAKPKKKKPQAKQLTPEQLKQLEIERRAQERENLKAQKKMIADFKKLWFKPKEDLEVEDLKDIPQPDPICCKIPNNLFGDFIMILEYFNCYSSLLKVRDCFPSGGLNFDSLERALVKNEIAGPLSDILQLLLRAIFRCQLNEESEILQDQATAASVEVGIDEFNDCASAKHAVEQATAAATWSIMYQNTALNKLTLDHLSLTEILRLHLLSSGARPTEKDIKWRLQQRGGYTNIDDAGLQLRMEEPQILKVLTNGTVFDLNIKERIKLILCLINQVLTYVSVRDIIDDSFEQFKQARINLRTIQAAEKRKETEDNVWRQKLKSEKRLPPPDFMKSVTVVNAEKKEEEGENTVSEPSKSNLKPELTDEQIDTYLIKRDKETARRKQDYEWKVTELMDMINKHERKLGLHPVGRDRAFRRYWIFATLPGLFVEDDDSTIGPCLSCPTPCYSNVNLEDLKFVEENFEKLRQDKDGSDKENSTSVTPVKVSKKKSVSSDGSIQKQPEIYGICNGDQITCQVHGVRPAKWYFYWNSDQLEALINGLSPRGVRENELRSYLKDELSGIMNILQRCPVRKLNTEKIYPESVTTQPERRPQRALGQAASKGGLDPNLNYPYSTPIETVQELQLRDMILEIEEKIFLGALGSLKVSERSEWRKAIEQRTYDAQTDKLTWGEGRSKSTLTKMLGMNSRSQNEEQAGSSMSVVNDSIQQNESNSNILKSLACAILQLEQSVEPKFFRKPLGNEKDEDKKKKSKAGEVEQVISKGKWIQGSALERWETSLLKCTSFSQLFVHLFTMDNSIEWTRSVLNARCRICRRKGDSENMLLCDSCNKGHHLYCVKPQLESVPKGDWFCSDCRPPELEPRKRTPRKAFISEDELSESDKGNSDENASDESDRESPGPARLEVGGSEVEVCAECGFGGEVICCDNCPLVYHLQCLDPPKSRVPRGSWNCPECDNCRKKKVNKKGKQTKKTIPKKKRRIVSSSDESEEVDDESEGSDGQGPDDTHEQSGNETDESSHQPLVKMKFRTRKAAATNSSNHKNNDIDEYEERESDEDAGFSRKNKSRKCASQTVARIAKAVKRLRSDSKENDDSSNDSSSASSNGRTRMHHNDDKDDTDSSRKKTRLHRVNRCGESGDLDNVLLDKLVNEIMKQPSSWPFLKPVTRHDAPDYHDIIKCPMDLGTIKYKLNSMVYTCNQEFFADLQQVFDNCFLYNKKENDVYRAGEKLRAFCEKRCSSLGVSFFSDSN